MGVKKHEEPAHKLFTPITSLIKMSAIATVSTKKCRPKVVYDRWRVMLNSKLWDQTRYVELYKTSTESHRIAQSKGQCPMVKCPQRGDEVSFVLKGNVVMKGVVDSDGFEFGTEHQNHPCNIGPIRPHADNEQFIWVKIEMVNLSEPIRHTGQRTWAKMPSS
jgi:hypothetical protein